MTVTHDAPAIPAPAAVTAATLHPTPCPSWCKDRSHRIRHSFGPTATWHWSPQYTVGNPRPLDAGPAVILRAELFVGDEGDRRGDASLYVQGETDIDLSAAEADIFITNMQAFVDTLRVLRSQMG
jgi:hypothetical protein